MENKYLEYKSEIPKKINQLKAEIVSFLNSSGGTIILGADDDGNIIEEKKKEYKKWEELLNNLIFNAFHPSVIDLIDLDINSAFKIIIKKGNEKPYFYKDGDNFNANGVYIRVGSSKRKASFDEIKRMILANKSYEYEYRVSDKQELTFNYLTHKFMEQNIIFDIRGSNLMSKDGLYNNAALLLSDNNETITKFAIFQGKDVSLFLDKKEFSGSIMKQLEDVRNYAEIINKKKIIITGKAQHDEYRDYPERALREAICNCYCHRDWTLTGDIKIEFYEDRVMIFSPGSIPNGLTLDNIKNGATAKRNQIVVDALSRADYIENYASGIRRIFKDYEGFTKQPEFYISDNLVRVTLYNRNYRDDIDEPKDEPKNEPKDELKNLQPLDRQQKIILLMYKNAKITINELSNELKVSKATIKRDIEKLKSKDLIFRMGSFSNGAWIVPADKLKNE